MKRSFKIKIKKSKKRIPIDKKRSQIFDDKRLKRQKTRQNINKKYIEEQNND